MRRRAHLTSLTPPLGQLGHGAELRHEPGRATPPGSRACSASTACSRPLREAQLRATKTALGRGWPDAAAAAAAEEEDDEAEEEDDEAEAEEEDEEGEAAAEEEAAARERSALAFHTTGAVPHIAIDERRR